MYGGINLVKGSGKDKYLLQFLVKETGFGRNLCEKDQSKNYVSQSCSRPFSLLVRQAFSKASNSFKSSALKVLFESLDKSG